MRTPLINTGLQVIDLAEFRVSRVASCRIFDQKATTRYLAIMQLPRNYAICSALLANNLSRSRRNRSSSYQTVRIIPLQNCMLDNELSFWTRYFFLATMLKQILAVNNRYAILDRTLDEP